MKKLILLFLSFCAFQSFAQVPAVSATTRWQCIDGNNIFAISAADVVTYSQANLSGLAPTGGSTGQVLTKINGTNYNYSWQTPSGGISGSGTTAFIPKFSSSSALTNSKLFETTNTVSLGASTGIDAFTRFYVYGGSSGANIDVRGAPGSATDQAVCELQGADYSTSFKSMWLRYQGTDAVGTTLGLANANLGELTFADPDNVLLRVIPNIPMRFSINSVEQARLDTSGWQLRSRKSLRYYDSDNTQYVELRAPSTSGLTTSYSLSLPVDDGTSGQYLKTDGSGVLSWDTPSGGGGGDFIPLDNAGLGLTGYGGDFTWKSSPGDFESGLVWDGFMNITTGDIYRYQGAFVWYSGASEANTRAFFQSNGEEVYFQFGAETPGVSNGAVNASSTGILIQSNDLVGSRLRQLSVYNTAATEDIEILNSDGGFKFSSTTGAIVPPKLTTPERDALTPDEGWTIYNTTLHKLQVYDGSTWQSAW